MSKLTDKWLNILDALQALHWSEAGAVLFGVLYLVYAIREHPICWFLGIISCALWAYAAFVLLNLYVDALLQLFYIGMSIWGIYHWRRGGAKKLPVTTMTFREHIVLITFGLALSWAVGYWFDRYTAAAATYLDAFTTVFSILTTVLVVQKKLENWLYWLVIDVVYVYLYWSRGGYLFTLLFLLYLVLAIDGFRQWRRSYRQERIST